MFIRFYDVGGLPYRSFYFSNLEFKSVGVKVTDDKGICHLVQKNDYSFFVVFKNFDRS